MTAYLIVRAEVEPSLKSQFDSWYQNEHLPEAFQAFDAVTAKRGWSSFDADVHIAYYEFPTLDAAETMIKSDVMKALIEDFDRHWGTKVVRTREIVEICQQLP